MRGKLAPRLGDARSGLCGAVLGHHARAVRSGCLQILNQQLQLLDLVRALFTAFLTTSCACFSCSSALSSALLSASRSASSLLAASIALIVWMLRTLAIVSHEMK